MYVDTEDLTAKLLAETGKLSLDISTLRGNLDDLEEQHSTESGFQSYTLDYTTNAFSEQ